MRAHAPIKRFARSIVKAFLPLLLGLGCERKTLTERPRSPAPPAAAPVTVESVLSVLRTEPAGGTNLATVVSIAASFDPDALASDREFAAACAQAGVRWEQVLLDAHETAFRQAGVRALPTRLALDAQGRLLAKHAGHVVPAVVLGR